MNLGKTIGFVTRVVSRQDSYRGDSAVIIHDGDKVLGDLGIPGATFGYASSFLWQMLSGHLFLAFCGLLFSKQEP